MQIASLSLQTIGLNQQRLELSAERISRIGQDPGVDLANEVTEQLHVRRSTQAQVAVLRAADDMLGLVLDLKA